MEYISGLTSDLSPRGSIGTVALAKDWGGWGVLVRKESLSTAPRVHTHFKKNPTARSTARPGGGIDGKVSVEGRYYRHNRSIPPGVLAPREANVCGSTATATSRTTVHERWKSMVSVASTIYGLRESPSIWAWRRSEKLRTLKLPLGLLVATTVQNGLRVVVCHSQVRRGGGCREPRVPRCDLPR